jgi:hypothetical protein
VFWSPAVNAWRLTGVLVRASDASHIDFNLRRFSGRIALLIGADGRQQLVVRSSHRILEMSLSGACALDPELRITFETHGLNGSAHASRVFKELALFVSGRSPGPEPAWTARSLSTRNALIALDGDAAGASYREIARVMFGAAYSDGTWRKKPSLKDGVRHALQRGRAMMAGGYRRLLT